MPNSRKSMIQFVIACVLLAVVGSAVLAWQKFDIMDMSKGKVFFNYNTIEAYHIDYEDTEMNRGKLSMSSTDTGKLKTDLLFTNTFPKDLTDTTWVEKLPEIGYTKRLLAVSSFPQIDFLFQEKAVKNPEFSQCLVVHRDILVFKKDNAITGIAKICFTCNQHHIIGALGNTKNFGQNGDYERLKLLLRK